MLFGASGDAKCPIGASACYYGCGGALPPAVRCVRSMSTKQALRESFPADTLLREELLAVSDDATVEMTNLSAKHTGIEGVVFISTVLGGHGPRVKYFLKAGGKQLSFSVSIATEPRVVANSLPDRVVNRVA